MTLRIAITPGEPAGIGPDILLQLAQSSGEEERVAITDPSLLQARAKHLGLSIQLKEVDFHTPAQPSKAGELSILPIRLNTPAIAGQLNPQNSAFVLETLDAAIDGCLQRQFAALVTGPVNKAIINDAGIPFTGHTEYLCQKANKERVVMMLATEGLRVALATTHLPLRDVSDAITPKLLTEVIHILHHDLRHHFGINNPRIVVCGLNPHAGEDGHLGDEEIKVITPTLNKLRQQGLLLTGPLPADTLFTPPHLERADAVLAMYHDQGLPVLKYKGFGQGVNITLGLPFIRTSVDHGTALDLAGTGKASIGSLQQALHYASQCINTTALQ